ncbi:MAG: hypothetical protein IKS28_06425 [Clostridia bacterium]|nr:hypothetical protein [Clostridia bacterium]
MVSCNQTSQPATGSAAVLKTVADLRTFSDKNVNSVITEGYNYSGDGCGYTYLRDTVRKNSSDNGGTVIVSEDGTRWRAVYSGALPLKLFGAAGDGSTDDTEAIKRWLNCLESGRSGYVTAGDYVFTEPLTFPRLDNVSVYGDGQHQSRFVYRGENRTADLITVGSEKTNSYGVELRGLNIESAVHMDGGYALRLVSLKHKCLVRDVSISSIDGKNGCNLWNGVFFDRCSLTDYVGFSINVQNEAISVCGTPSDDSAADILIDEGTIVGSRIGIHCGGGFGGLYVRQVLIYGCTETGYLQDNALAKRGNREIFISDMCVLDACHSYCALIDDSESLQCTLQFGAFISGAGWISPATPGVGLKIKSLPQGRVSVTSSHIKHCVSDGIQISDKTALIAFAPTVCIVGNGGYGIRMPSDSGGMTGSPILLSNSLGKIKKD